MKLLKKIQNLFEKMHGKKIQIDLFNTRVASTYQHHGFDAFFFLRPIFSDLLLNKSVFFKKKTIQSLYERRYY